MNSLKLETLLEVLSEQLAERVCQKVCERLMPSLAPQVVSTIVQEQFTESFVTVSDLVKRLKVSRSTLWRLERGDDFPKPVKAFKNRKVWLQSEIEAWMRQAR